MSWAQCEAPAAGEKYTLLSPKESTHTEVDDMTLGQKVQPECNFSLVVNFFMTEFFVSLLTNAYALMGILGLMAYAPTLLDVYNQRTSVNPWTYAMWWLASAVAALYLGFVVGNGMMLFVYSLHTLACSLVLSLNWRFQRRNRVARLSVPAEDLTVNNENLV